MSLETPQAIVPTPQESVGKGRVNEKEIERERPVLFRDTDDAHARRVTSYTNIEADPSKLALADGLELMSSLTEQYQAGLEAAKPIREDAARLQDTVSSRQALLLSLDEEIKSLRLSLGDSTQDAEIQAARKNLLTQKAAERAKVILELPGLEKRLVEAQRLLDEHSRKGPIVFDHVGKDYADNLTSRAKSSPDTQSPEFVSSSVPASVSSEFPNSEQQAYSLAEKRQQFLRVDNERAELQKEVNRLAAEFDVVDAEEVTGDQPKRWNQLRTELAAKEALLAQKNIEKKAIGDDIVRSVRTKTVN